jgi:hypothetical protein
VRDPAPSDETVDSGPIVAPEETTYTTLVYLYIDYHSIRA